MGKDDDQLIGAFDLEEEMRKSDEEARAAVRAKDELIEKALANGKITLQLADFLKGIDTSTFGTATANLHKVELVLGMKEVLANKRMNERKTVSLYSGFDWRFPVALGARDITMVDTGFTDDGGLAAMVVNQIREYDPEMIHAGNTISFDADLGSGKERVRLNLDPSSADTYSNADGFDFVLESHGRSGDYHRSALPTSPSLANTLAEGALVFNDRYVHDGNFTPDLGLVDIGVDGHHFYEVIDREKMIIASTEVVRNSPPSLDQIRQALRNREDSAQP